MQDGFPTTKAEIVQAEEERQVRKVEANAADIMKWEEYLCEDAEVIVVAFGSTSRSARFAVDQARKQGIKAGLFRPDHLLAVPGRASSSALQAGQGVYLSGDESWHVCRRY